MKDGGTLTISDLMAGTRIYYSGDMANEEGYGTISRTWRDSGGDHVEIAFDDGRKTRIQPFQFSREYLGHGGTRFVTEAAYKKYRAEQTELFFSRMREIKAAKAN